MKLNLKLFREVLGEAFTVDVHNEYLRIATGFSYFDGDLVDVFAQQTGDCIRITDLGEASRISKNRFTSYSASIKQKTILETMQILDVIFEHGIVSEVISGSNGLRNAVIRVALGSSAVSFFA